MQIHPHFREIILRDNQRELDRTLRKAQLRREYQQAGAMRTEPGSLDLEWQRIDDRSRFLMRAVWCAHVV